MDPQKRSYINYAFFMKMSQPEWVKRIESYFNQKEQLQSLYGITF